MAVVAGPTGLSQSSPQACPPIHYTPPKHCFVFQHILMPYKIHLSVAGWEDWKTLEEFLSGFTFLSSEEREVVKMELVYYIEFGKYPTVEDLAPEHF